MTDDANKICRCYKVDCLDCMTRYRKATEDFDRDTRPGGRIHRKLQELHELVDRIVAQREGKVLP